MSRVKFKEDTHQYFNERDEEYVSVSKFIDRFKAPKDWNEIRKKYAKKHGETPEYWKAKWEAKNKLSTERGSLYHKMREDAILYQESVKAYKKDCIVKACTFSDGFKWSISNKLENNTMYPELMIYDHENKICGQSDKVIVVDKTINIWDYKTDKVLEYQAYSSEWVSPEKLLAPLDHLDNCNINLYSLKMSLYMYMLWKQNKTMTPGDLVIEHITLARDEDGVPILSDETGLPIELDRKEVFLPYRVKEVKKLLQLCRK